MKKNNATRKNIIFSNTSSVYSEAFQHIQVNLDFSFVDGQKKIIAITSALPSEGKSTILANLAFIYAKKDFKVLLIDMDLRKPTIHRFFHEEKGLGLSDYCTKQLKKEEIIKHTDLGIDFISSGTHAPFPGKILESNSLLELIEEVKNDYDYILIDTPPVLASSDAILISKFVKQFLVVVSYGKTKKSDFDELVRQFTNNNIEILGVIFNKIKKNSKDAYSYSYHYQYKEENKK